MILNSRKNNKHYRPMYNPVMLHQGRQQQSGTSLEKTAKMGLSKDAEEIAAPAVHSWILTSMQSLREPEKDKLTAAN